MLRRAGDVTALRSVGERELVVMSDLHLGRGVDRSTKRYHRLEAFFYDDDFRAFCAWLCADAAARSARFALVLNGDILDLLRIEPEPAPDANPSERRFGPAPTPAIAARMVADILEGHGLVVEALAEVLAAGHDVVLVAGNHDLELQWDPVQDEVRRAVAAALDRRGARPGAIERLAFEPWFHHEPGRVWIEHGCQYDPENAFRFPLRRELADADCAAEVWRRDMPLGNFFQKYLYNAFGPIAFLVPSSRANYRYFRFLLANRPRLVLRVLFSQALFLVELLRRLARPADREWQEEAQAAHRAELRRLAARSGLGPALYAVDALKFVGADAAHAAAGLARQWAKLAVGASATAVLAVFLYDAAARAIELLHVSFGWKAALSLALELTFAALAATGVVAAALRLPRVRPPRRVRAAAERIAEILDVPIVAFGHTHEEVVAPVERPGGAGWYFNTGTWLAVFNDDALAPRERVQYTFLRVRGADGELLQWSPARSRPIPVVLLDEEERRAAAEKIGRAAGRRPFVARGM